MVHLDNTLEKVEAVARMPDSGANALLLFDCGGRLLRCAGGAAELLGFDPSAECLHLSYEAFLSRAKARAGEIVAILPRQVPPPEGVVPGGRLDCSGPYFASTLFALGDLGYALVLQRTGSAATAAQPPAAVGDATRGGFAEQAADWLWEMDTQWRFTYVSRRYQSINDLPIPSILGRTRWEVAAGDPNRDPLWHRHLADIEAHRPIRDFRYSDRDASGRMRHFCVNGDPIYTSDGTFAGYRGIGRDETDEVEAQQRAASAERLLSAAIERLPDGFMLYDPNDRLLMANAEMRRRLGPDAADILKPGRTFEEILRLCVERGLYAGAEGREQAFVAERMAAYRNAGAAFRFRRKGDRWIEARSARTGEGHTIVLLADITERVLAERTLIEFAETMAEKNRQADLARQAAEQSEARFREFTDLASDWVWEMDPEARFTAASGRIHEIGLFPVEQIIGKTRWEFAGADPDTDPFWGRHRADYMAHRPFRDLRYSDRDPSGRLRHFRVSGNPVFAADGTFTGYRGVARDETEEVEARRQAERAEALLRAAIDALPQGFALYDPDERLVMFNRALAERLGPDADILQCGRTLEEILRLSFARSTHPHALSEGKLEKFIADRLAQHRNPGKVSLYRGWRGRWIESHSVRTPDGYTLGIRTDVTERLVAERKLIEFASSLAEKNRQLDLALANSSNGIAFHDDQGHLLLWNRRYVELYDLQEEELRVGMHLREEIELSRRSGNLSSQEGERVTAERLKSFASRERVVFRQTLLNGRVIEGTHVPLPGGGAVSTYVDITDRERRQGELIKSKEEAESANRTKSDFLANVSHELRTPLNAVIGFSEMLMLDYGGMLSEKQRDYVRDIRASGTFLLSIIDDILDLTKIEANKELLDYEPIMLAELMDGCRRMVLSRLALHTPELRVELPETLPSIEADPRKLRQILINLLTNACKFTPPDGTVVLQASSSDGRMIEIRVRDSGVGIAAADLPRVMEPFYRAAGPFARRSEGAGLGLPLAKALAELHGGKLTIESELGVGTTATLHLPLRRPKVGCA